MDANALGISTAWNAAGVLDGQRIVDDVLRLGLRRLEVGYTVRVEAVGGIEDAVRSGQIEVTSIHNYAPLYPDEKPCWCGGDKLALSSTDETERSEAVRLTLVSLDLARRLGARALILHTGEVDGIGRDYFDELAEIVKSEGVESAKACSLRQSVAAERDRRKGPHLEAVVRSLKDLLRRAEEWGIAISIENRYFYHQIPLPGETLAMIEDIGSPLVRYWHDIGHGHVLDILGFAGHLASLDLLSTYLLGMHVHDSRFTRDHIAPGRGEIALDGVFARTPGSALRILELAPSVPEDDVAAAIRQLARY
jgi:sugar phosphate isomerase/epimerase